MSAPLATPTNPAADTSLMQQYLQAWPQYAGMTPSGVPNGPIGIYKVKTLEATTLWNPADHACNIAFDAANPDQIDLGLGANLSTLQVSAPSASSVQLNATSIPGFDSSFVLQSGSASKALTVTTSGQQTGLVSTAAAIELASGVAGSGSASFLFGPQSATLQSGLAAAPQQLNLFASNVEVRAAVLNANADVQVKGSYALQKTAAGAMAVGQYLSPADVTTVTVGGGAGVAPVATFQTSTTGTVPQAWLNGNAHYFSGSKVGINWANAPFAQPQAELDVNGTIIARTALQASNLWALGGNTMTLGWDVNALGQADLKKIVLQADTIEMVGDINMMNKTDLRVMDTAIYLGHIPGETTLDGNVDQANATAPGTYSDTYYDGAGVILWNLPDGYEAFYNAASVPAADKPVLADYQQSLRWYKRGGVFDSVNVGQYVPAWNRSAWEVSGGNLMLRSGTGHASYMFAVDYTDDSLKLYKVDSSTVKEVANFNSLA